MAKKQYLLSYTIVFWILFFITTTLFIIDRFTTNIWPRQSFATENHGTGTDRKGYKDGPATVIVYQVIARFSGRYTMAALNALFFTMMHTTHRYLSKTWIGIYLIDFRDDVARLQIHKWMGISLCIITLLHVWSILFPVMFSGYSVEVNLGYFSWPLSEQTPKGFQDVNSTTQTMMMQGDDVYRLILMSIMLGPIIYLSAKWLCSNYRLGIRLHQFIMLMYFIDIVRRHTHPHSWVFNTPVLFAWIFDCIWGHFYLAQSTTVSKIELSPDYMLLLWKSKHTAKNYVSSIGDVFFMRTKYTKPNSGCCCGVSSCCQWERDHPFTSFNKRAADLSSMQCRIPYNSKLKVDFGTVKSIELTSNEHIQVPDSSENVDWDRGVVIRSYNGKHSHTKHMRDTQNLHMDIWGGFHAGAIADYINAGEDVILIGGGSGSGYLIDTLFFLCENRKYLDEQSENRNKEKGEPTNISAVGIIFTSNDLNLVQWWTNIIDNILSNNKLPQSKCLSIRITLTNGNGATHGVTSLTAHDISWGTISLGRCKFEDEIKTMTLDSKNIAHVFCQGGESLQNATRKAAKITGKKYYEGHSYDNAKQKRTKMCGCMSKKISPV